MAKKYRYFDSKFRILRGADSDITRKINTWLTTGYRIKNMVTHVDPKGGLIVHLFTYKRELLK